MSHRGFGPLPLWNNTNLPELGTQDKWLIAGVVCAFGGGVAFLIYKRKFGQRNSNQQRSTTKQPHRNLNMEFSCIRDLPPEIRTKIWQALPYEDILNLRLASQFTKFDIDTFVGLCGRITTADPQKYDFYQSIALRSCKITELLHPISQDFFLNPSILQNLEIREHSPIPLDNIRAILAVSINLKSLKLRLTLNDNTQEISQMVLECLPEMKSLVLLNVKTASRFFAEEVKNFTMNAIHFTSPKHLKTVNLEMQGVSAQEMSKWKCVLDRQVVLENLSMNMGNVHWRFYEQVIRQNYRSIENIVLEGIRGWDSNRNEDDPFDWSIFAHFVTLKHIGISCNLGGDHDLVNSVNFERFPCLNITEFFVSRILMPPEAVERVYTQMRNLQRGALDNIGHLGIERANEMAWIFEQTDAAENGRWWHDERLWDMIAHGIFGVTMAIFLTYVVKLKNNGNYAVIGEELHYYKQENSTGRTNINDDSFPYSNH